MASQLARQVLAHPHLISARYGTDVR